MAAANGHVEIVDTLVQAGADPNAAASNGSTSLMMAALNQHLPVLQYLLQIEGIEMDAFNTTPEGRGTTAFHLACANADLPAVKLLVEAGCNRMLQCRHCDRVVTGLELAQTCWSPGGAAVVSFLKT
jgi:ankyrin repeat protein